jgi:carbamoyl-phosphate synthase large subunit
VLPPYNISQYHLDIIRDYTRRIGLALGVKGLFNIQFAIKDEVVYVLEVNPRSSRTVPFVAKATGVPLARYGAMIAAGKTLAELGFTEEPKVEGFFVKEAVLPFQKFPGVDARLGPEMRSTGEVMGHASSFGHAFIKAQMAASMPLPLKGTVCISVNDFDKGAVARIARELHDLGFKIIATKGTSEWLNKIHIETEPINKVNEGSPHIVDALREGNIQLIINTPYGGQAHDDGAVIRSMAYQVNVPLVTTMSAAMATLQGIKRRMEKDLQVKSLQEHHGSKSKV